MTDEQLNQKLNEIKNAAADLIMYGSEAFRATRPSEHEDMAKCAKQYGVTVHLLPEVRIECWAEEPGCVRQVFATLHAQERRPDLAQLN